MPVLEDLTQKATCSLCGDTVVVQEAVWLESYKIHPLCADSLLLEEMREGFTGVKFHVEHETKKLLLPYSKNEVDRYNRDGDEYSITIGEKTLNGTRNGGVVWLY